MCSIKCPFYRAFLKEAGSVKEQAMGQKPPGLGRREVLSLTHWGTRSRLPLFLSLQYVAGRGDVHGSLCWMEN